MPTVRIQQTRTLSSPGASADAIQTRVTDYDSTLPLPMGAVVVAANTPLSDWANASAAPVFDNDPNRPQETE